jgi:hypothetical protein
MTDELQEFRDNEKVIALRDALATVTRQLAVAKQRTHDYVAAAQQGAYEAALLVGRPEPLTPDKDRRKRGEEVALWHLTDWQGAKLTTSYSSDVMKARVRQFLKRATAITEIQRADHPVKRAVIMLGGDMIEGLFQFPTQPFEIDATIFEQYVTVGTLLVETVISALSVYEHVTVVSEWGNHGRMGSKRDAIPRSDNIDRMTYELARRQLSGFDRLTWHDSAEDIQRVEIGNYRALLAHGDEVGRHGYASPATWIAHGNRWLAGAYKVKGKQWPFRDIYLGHYHRHGQEPLSDGLGAIYWTGSTESDNRYASESMAVSGEPSQRLHFVDPEKGRVTASYQVWLD